MSRLSTVLKENNGIPEKEKKKFAKCIFCGKEIKQGGAWMCADEEIGVCKDDSHMLIDLYIDTMTDVGTYSGMPVERKKEMIFSLVEKRVLKKESIDMRNETRKAFEKLGMTYFCEVSPIDFWALSMTKEELKEKLLNSSKEYEYGEFEDTSYYVDICEQSIIQVVEKVSKEKPHTIEYFTVPNIDGFEFSIGCAAKIDNNGATYIFLGNRKILEAIASDIYPNIENTLGKLGE